MDTKKIARLAGQSEIMQKFARDMREAKSRGFVPHIGGKYEGSAHASIEKVETLNCPLMPQAVRDQIANAFGSAAGILNQLLKAEVDMPLADDHHTIAAEAMEKIKDVDGS
jgi:hypothetical protein